MPKATQQPQCKAALIKFAWEFPLQLEAHKIKCQDLGKKNISCVSSICIRKRKEPSPEGEWICLGQSGTDCWFQGNNQAKREAAGTTPRTDHHT